MGLMSALFTYPDRELIWNAIAESGIGAEIATTAANHLPTLFIPFIKPQLPNFQKRHLQHYRAIRTRQD